MTSKRIITQTNNAPKATILTHAAKIKGAWQKAVSSIVETGQLLISAKDDPEMRHGEFMKIFEVDRFPFGIDAAEKLMKIARHPVLSKSEFVMILPPSWGTLATLSRASPKQLEKWLTDGTVNAGTERVEAEALVRSLPRPKVLEQAQQNKIQPNDKPKKPVQEEMIFKEIGHLTQRLRNGIKQGSINLDPGFELNVHNAVDELLALFKAQD